MLRQRVDFENSRLIAPFRKHASKLAALLTILVALFPYSISLGDEGVSLSVVNNTSFYLHALINNQPFVYIAPGGAITFKSESFASISAQVSYSPGQGRTGSKTRTFIPVRRATHAKACSNNKSGCQSSTSSETSVDPLVWTVLSSDLTSHEPKEK